MLVRLQGSLMNPVYVKLAIRLYGGVYQLASDDNGMITASAVALATGSPRFCDITVDGAPLSMMSGRRRWHRQTNLAIAN